MPEHPLDAPLIPLKVHADARGHLYELLSATILPAAIPGLAYLCGIRQGAVRGGHLHLRKDEWFLCLHGEALVTLRLAGDERRRTLSAEAPAWLPVPAGVWHALRSTGPEEALILAYVTEPYDPNDPDTYRSPG